MRRPVTGPTDRVQREPVPARAALVIGANCAAAFQIGKVPGVLPLLRDDLGLSLVQLGWIFSSSSVIAAVTAFLVPSLGRLTSPRRLVAAGLALLATGSLAGAMAPDATWLVGTRVVESAGLLLIAVGGPAYLVATTPPATAATLMGFWPAAMPTGTAAAMFLTPALADQLGWRAVWVCGGIVALAALLALPGEGDARVVHPARGPRHGVLTPLRQLRSGITLCLGITSVCYSLLWLGVLGLLPVWYDERLHLGVVPATALTGVAFLANAVTTVLAGALQHRGAAGWALIAAAGGVFLPSVWLIYAASLPIVIAALAACTLSGAGGLLASASMRAIARHSADAVEAGDRVAVVVQFINVGQLSGPPLVALVVGAGAPAAVAAVLSVPALLVVVGGVWLRGLDRLLSRAPETASPLRSS